ncbi:hypothetical protein AB0I28_14695 [Phytomonospora sp. NPDC050363]|uniref:hypothetical protein n=1 Tax=Phytomonospora sp. NPDC050363 TaxID=3155642 RepID=UPI0033F026FC
MEVGREIATETLRKLHEDADRRVDTYFSHRPFRTWLDDTTALSTGVRLTRPLRREHVGGLFFVPDPLAVGTRVPADVARLHVASSGYRLPRPEELEDPAAPDFGPHCVWVDHGGLALWRPPGVRDPFAPSEAEPTDDGSGRETPFDLAALLLPLAAIGRLLGSDLMAAVRLAREGPVRHRARAFENARRVAAEWLGLAGEDTDPALRDFLRLVDSTLAVHELRANGTIAPNEILVLARD